MRKEILTPLLLLVLGTVLPFAANFIGGTVNGFSPGQYIFIHGSYAVKAEGIAFLVRFNTVAVVAAFASYLLLFRARPLLRLLPAGAGYAFLAFTHYYWNLASDAQAALGLVFIPIYAAFLTGAVTLLVLLISIVLWGRRYFRRTDVRVLPSGNNIAQIFRDFTVMEYIAGGVLLYMGSFLGGPSALICAWLLRKRSKWQRLAPAACGLVMQSAVCVILYRDQQPPYFMFVPFTAITIWVACVGTLWAGRRAKELACLLLIAAGVLAGGCSSAPAGSFGLKWYIAYKDCAKAAPILRRGLETDSYQEALWRAMVALALAKSEERLANTDEMFAAYEISMAAYETPEAYYWRGCYYLAHGEKEKAAADLDKALSLINAEMHEWRKLPFTERAFWSMNSGRGYDQYRIFLRGNIFRQTNITRLRAEDFHELLRLSILNKLHEAEGQSVL